MKANIVIFNNEKRCGNIFEEEFVNIYLGKEMDLSDGVFIKEVLNHFKGKSYKQDCLEKITIQGVEYEAMVTLRSALAVVGLSIIYDTMHEDIVIDEHNTLTDMVANRIIYDCNGKVLEQNHYPVEIFVEAYKEDLANVAIVHRDTVYRLQEALEKGVDVDASVQKHLIMLFDDSLGEPMVDRLYPNNSFVDKAKITFFRYKVWISKQLLLKTTKGKKRVQASMNINLDKNGGKEHKGLPAKKVVIQ